MIHLYCCYTEAHEVLFREYFVPSLTNNVLVHARRIDVAEGKGDFLSAEFLDCIRRKIDLIIASIDRHPGEIIVWSDIDIVLYGDFEPDVRKQFAERPELEMLLQREGKHTSDVNSGFFAMRCGPSSRRFFETVKSTMLANPEKNEQPVVNEILFGKEKILEWDYFPFEYAARSQDWPPHEGMRLYHANCTAGADGINQKKKQFSSLQKYQKYSPVKVCIVTPEMVGPRRNSGIGTHAYYLSRHLAAQQDHAVTVLLTADTHVERGDDEGSWSDHFKSEHNVELVEIESLDPLYPEVGWFNQWFSQRSQMIYAWLRDKDFDIIHFQDLNADGFYTLQARETAAGFQKCVVTVTVNGPNLWARQGMKQFADSAMNDPLVNYCESYCIEKADIVISPSDYALEWCRSQDWKLSDRQHVCPYLIEQYEPVNQPGQPFEKPDEIIFFGRLETRKGLEIFLKALKQIKHDGKLDSLERIWFLGAYVTYLDYDSRNIIYNFFRDELHGIAFTIEAYLGHEECLEFLRNHKRALVVTPSLSETLGYTVIESLELNLNIVATKGGAIPELFNDDSRLCEPKAAPLAELMSKGLENTLPLPDKAYSRNKSQAAWAKVSEECVTLLQGKMKAMEVVIDSPLISVGIPHYNYGPFLVEQLASLAAQTYPNFKVTVLDDGSSDAESIRIFAELRIHYAGDDRFKFIEQPNGGLCAARNRLANEAEGDFLVFCDADNISEPEMLEVFARSIQVSGADCVTCHMTKFRVNKDSGEVEKLDAYTPIGPCIEAGPFCDPFGDANFIIRKPVFESVGGFRHVPETASEDWEFLAKLCMDGFKLEVVPMALFKYREHGESNMRQTPFYDTRMRVLQPYFDSLPEKWQKRMLYNTVGAHERLMSFYKRGMADVVAPIDVSRGFGWLEERCAKQEGYINELESGVKWLEETKNWLEKHSSNQEMYIKELEGKLAKAKKSIFLTNLIGKR